jgi:hypothetical protein
MDGQDMARRAAAIRTEADADARIEVVRRRRRRRVATAETCVELGRQPEKRFEPLQRERTEPGLRMDHARLRAPTPRQG